ncbi:MAG: hypothetical protein Q8L57_00645, partial [bacterium]|nr:hypothetical protein [bacterium]
MNRKIKIIILIWACFLLLFLASEAVVLAQGYKLEFKIPKMPDTVTLPQYLRGIFIFGLAAVGITAMAS